MDSGNGHLAAMYGIPVITVWGVTHPYAGFAPFLQPEENSITADREQFPLIPTSVYGNKVWGGNAYDPARADLRAHFRGVKGEELTCRVQGHRFEIRFQLLHVIIAEQFRNPGDH